MREARLIGEHDVVGPGTVRGLRALTTAGGLVAAVAVDQRQALRRMLADAGAAPDADSLRAFKVAVGRALGDIAPALLTDPEFGLPAISSDPAISARLPLMLSIEESGTLPCEGGKRSLALAGWSAEAARRHGAIAAKLLVYARADHAATLGHAERLIRAVRADCRRADLPFVLEILPYRLDDEDEEHYRHAFGRHVLEVAAIGDDARPDLLKLAWPGALGSDGEEPGGLDRLAAMRSPWALLSAGAPFETFERRVALALERGGACGFIAGRALWADAVGAPDLESALRSGARPRLERLLATVEGRGRPLPLPAVPDAPEWYL